MSSDTRWRDIQANFSGAHAGMQGASSTLSNVGDVFGKITDRIQAHQDSVALNDYRNRTLAENARQFNISDANVDLSRAQDLDVAKMDDETTRRNQDITERINKANNELQYARLKQGQAVLDREAAWNAEAERQIGLLTDDSKVVERRQVEVSDALGKLEAERPKLRPEVYESRLKTLQDASKELDQRSEALTESSLLATAYKRASELVPGTGKYVGLASDRAAMAQERAIQTQKAWDEEQKSIRERDYKSFDDTTAFIRALPTSQQGAAEAIRSSLERKFKLTNQEVNSIITQLPQIDSSWYVPFEGNDADDFLEDASLIEDLLRRSNITITDNNQVVMPDEKSDTPSGPISAVDSILANMEKETQAKQQAVVDRYAAIGLNPDGSLIDSTDNDKALAGIIEQLLQGKYSDKATYGTLSDKQKFSRARSEALGILENTLENSLGN